MPIYGLLCFQANCAQAEYLCELPTDLVGQDSAGSGQVTGPSSQNSNAGQSGATSSQDNAALQDSTDTAGQDSAGSGQDKEGANLSYSDEGAACSKGTGSCSEVACPVGQEGSTSSSYSSHLSGESGLRSQEETKEEEDGVERIEEEGCSAGANQSPVGEGEGEAGMGTESNSSSESSREARRKLVVCPRLTSSSVSVVSSHGSLSLSRHLACPGGCRSSSGRWLTRHHLNWWTM